MTRGEAEATVEVLRSLRRAVLSGKTVSQAWLDAARIANSRDALLRHVRPGVRPFDASPSLACADKLPKRHALKWIDTAIAYAEEHGQ